MIFLRAFITLLIMGGVTANAVAIQANDASGGFAAIDAAMLLQFYPTPLATSPVGATEDVFVSIFRGVLLATRASAQIAGSFTRQVSFG